jgi:hypothetical protein
MATVPPYHTDSTWRELERILAGPHQGLNLDPSEILTGPAAVADDPSNPTLQDRVDVACRHFAESQKWPDRWDFERTEIQKRLLFGLLIVKAHSRREFDKRTSQIEYPPDPSLSTREMLEWLLIGAWYSGGSSHVFEIEKLIAAAERQARPRIVIQTQPPKNPPHTGTANPERH